MNALIDFVEIKHADRTHKWDVSFRKLACYLNKYGRQAAIFENSFYAVTIECLDGFC